MKSASPRGRVLWQLAPPSTPVTLTHSGQVCDTKMLSTYLQSISKPEKVKQEKYSSYLRSDIFLTPTTPRYNYLQYFFTKRSFHHDVVQCISRIVIHSWSKEMPLHWDCTELVKRMGRNLLLAIHLPLAKRVNWELKRSLNYFMICRVCRIKTK